MEDINVSKQVGQAMILYDVVDLLDYANKYVNTVIDYINAGCDSEVANHPVNQLGLVYTKTAIASASSSNAYNEVEPIANKIKAEYKEWKAAQDAAKKK